MSPIISKLIKRRRKAVLTKHLSATLGRRLTMLAGAMVILIITNSTAMVIFESLSVGDALWLSFTTLTTVGYGDYSPATLAGRVTTIITMYGFAITLLSLIAAEVIEWRLGKSEKKRKGLWEFRDMSDHIQIINTPNVDTDRYLERLVTEIQATESLGDHPIQLLTRKYPDGLPQNLIDLKLLHRTGAAEDGKVIKTINLEKAEHVLILARDTSDSLSDSLTFDILSQVVDVNPDANIVVEVVLDENRQRFIDMGASVVIRPIRAYPEIIVRAMSNPGTEQVLEDLFDAHGDSIHKVSCKFSDISWGEIVQACVSKRIGTPIGYFDGSELHMHPDFDEKCTGNYLAVLTKKDGHSCSSQLEEALRAA